MASHDKSYKLLFSHHEMVPELVLGLVCEVWVQQVVFLPWSGQATRS